MMKSTTTEATIRKLCQIFSNHGLSESIVSDNRPQSSAEKFQNYSRSRGIHHITIAPYCPSSNWEAERLVQTFKAILIKQISK